MVLLLLMVMVFLMVDVSVCPVVIECRISGLRIFEFSNMEFFVSNEKRVIVLFWLLFKFFK